MGQGTAKVCFPVEIHAERWHPVVGFEGTYRVSTVGRVESLPRTCNAKLGSLRSIRSRYLKLGRHRDGHVQVELNLKGEAKKMYVHRLVLEAFIGPCPEGMECRHLNGVPWDNRVENLCWGTPAENKADQFLHGGSCTGENNPNVKLMESEVRMIRRLRDDEGMTLRALAKRYGVTKTMFGAIIKRKNWKHI